VSREHIQTKKGDQKMELTVRIFFLIQTGIRRTCDKGRRKRLAIARGEKVGGSE